MNFALQTMLSVVDTAPPSPVGYSYIPWCKEYDKGKTTRKGKSERYREILIINYKGKKCKKDIMETEKWNN